MILLEVIKVGLAVVFCNVVAVKKEAEEEEEEGTLVAGELLLAVVISPDKISVVIPFKADSENVNSEKEVDIEGDEVEV